MVIAKSVETLPYLSLGMVMASLYQQDALASHYRLHRPTPGGTGEFPIEPLLDTVLASNSPVCLFSSYVWNHELNIAIAAQIKQAKPDSTIIFGGPHVPRFERQTEAFLETHPHIDIAVLGEGEMACTDILAALATTSPDEALGQVTGIVYRKGGVKLRTADRDRMRALDSLPSPYLEGLFEPWLRDFPITVLETNRGCPFGCTYCDWGSATLQKVSKFGLDRLRREIDYLCDARSKTIFIADANFGMLEQDIAVAKALVDARKRTGYPLRLYTNFAKNGGKRLFSVIKTLHDGGLLPTGIIALQTTDAKVLQVIDRDNIRTSAYEELMGHFHREGIPMASDLMIGLPGQTLDSFAADLQFCFDWKVSAHGNYTSLMPNAPMARDNYREHWQIATDERNLITSTTTFSKADLLNMQDLYSCYQFFVRLGVFRHGLYCLQVDYKLPAIMAIRAWLDTTRRDPAQWPISSRVWHEILERGSAHADWAMLRWSANAHFLFDDPRPFYRELLDFLSNHFRLSLEDGVEETLVGAQAAVMPNRRGTYPLHTSLPHDIAAYIADIRAAPSLADLPSTLAPLGSRTPGSFWVSAPDGVSNPLKFQTLGGHADEWELDSPLAFHYIGEQHENIA